MAAPTSSIIDPVTSASVAVETNTRAARVSLYPNDVGLLGAYSQTFKTGIEAAGAAAASPIFSFRWAPATNTTALCVMRKMKFSLYDLGKLNGFVTLSDIDRWVKAKKPLMLPMGGWNDVAGPVPHAMGTIR